MFTGCETGFSCSRSRHQTSSDLREPLSSSDHGNRTTPARRCIKATQNFWSHICCKKVNFDFQGITSNLFKQVFKELRITVLSQITIHIRTIFLAVNASPVLFIQMNLFTRKLSLLHFLLKATI